MMIRTVLVGLVASLGLTLPSGKQLEAWKRSAESWVNARLAEWDGTMPNRENAFVYVDDHPAPPTPTDPTPPAAKAPELAKVETKAPLTISAKPETPNPAAEIMPMPVVPTQPVALDGDDVSPAAESEVVSDAAFLVALDESVKRFVADVARTEPAAIVSREAVDEDVFVIEDDVVFTTERGTEGLCVLNEPTLKPATTVEPVAIGDEFDPAIVFGFDEPESLSETTPCVPPAVVAEPTHVLVNAPATAPSGDQLTRAVRLTREAVFAWASLLNGPAVVTISP